MYQGEKLSLCEHLFQPSQKTLEPFPLLQVNEEQKMYPIPDHGINFLAMSLFGKLYDVTQG